MSLRQWQMRHPLSGSALVSHPAERQSNGPRIAEVTANDSGDVKDSVTRKSIRLFLA